MVQLFIGSLVGSWFMVDGSWVGCLADGSWFIVHGS